MRVGSVCVVLRTCFHRDECARVLLGGSALHCFILKKLKIQISSQEKGT
jgi:hypothetical protein